MRTPQILVVMPLYNANQFVSAAIESVLNQSFADFQLLIINDGSTDGSEEIARSYHDSRIKVFDQVNQGPGAAMNRALALACEAQIPYIARMDADDLSSAQRLATQINLLETNLSAAACSANSYYIDENSDNIIGTSTISNAPWLIRWEILHGLRGMIQGACMFRTEALYQVGGYRKQFKQAEETDLFLRLVERYSLINSLEFLYKIRIRTGSISLGDVHGNVLSQFYALDCYQRRYKDQPERNFQTFATSPGIKMKYRIWREENLLKAWRSSMGQPKPFSKIIAALLDPRRVGVRILRRIQTVNLSSS